MSDAVSQHCSDFENKWRDEGVVFAQFDLTNQYISNCDVKPFVNQNVPDISDATFKKVFGSILPVVGSSGEHYDKNWGRCICVVCRAATISQLIYQSVGKI